MKDDHGLYYCRQCVCLYNAGSEKMFQQKHMDKHHPAFHGSFDRFTPVMNEFQERFWTEYEERRW